MRYTWSADGSPQEWRLILGQAPGGGGVQAVWFDTWHMQEQVMVCEGGIDAHGVVQVRCSCTAPPGPDLGW